MCSIHTDKHCGLFPEPSHTVFIKGVARENQPEFGVKQIMPYFAPPSFMLTLSATFAQYMGPPKYESQLNVDDCIIYHHLYGICSIAHIRWLSEKREDNLISS